MYLLRNEVTGEFARHDSMGQQDGLTTDDVSLAREFATGGEASATTPRNVVEPFTFSAAQVDMGRAIRRELPAQ